VALVELARIPSLADVDVTVVAREFLSNLNLSGKADMLVFIAVERFLRELVAEVAHPLKALLDAEIAPVSF
jgi:hypothetical protein